MVARVGTALLEGRTFILLGLKRGNLYQIPNIVVRERGFVQIASPTTTLKGGEERGHTKNIVGGKVNGDRYIYTDYSLPLLEVLRMFLPNLLFFLKMKIPKDSIYSFFSLTDQQCLYPQIEIAYI